MRSAPIPTGMGTPRRRSADPDQAAARLHAAHDTLTALVEGPQSGQDWRDALAAAATVAVVGR